MPALLTRPAPTDYQVVTTELFRDRAVLLADIAALEAEPAGISRSHRLTQLRHKLDDVMARIVDTNYGLVIDYVRRFTGAEHDRYDEYEAAGVLGLMRAIASYDPDKGKFSTWAYKPIQREVLRAVQSNEYPNMNAGDFEARPTILKAQEALRVGDPSYSPSMEEVAILANVSEPMVRRVLMAPRFESLSKPVGEDHETELADLLGDDSEPIPEVVAAQLRAEALQRYALPELDVRERAVLAQRYGLDGTEEQRLSAIGRTMNLSREAVRQIENKALAKLNHPIVLRRLLRG